MRLDRICDEQCTEGKLESHSDRRLVRSAVGVWWLGERTLWPSRRRDSAVFKSPARLECVRAGSSDIGGTRMTRIERMSADCSNRANHATRTRCRETDVERHTAEGLVGKVVASPLGSGRGLITQAMSSMAEAYQRMRAAYQRRALGSMATPTTASNAGFGRPLRSKSSG